MSGERRVVEVLANSKSALDIRVPGSMPYAYVDELGTAEICDAHSSLLDGLVAQLRRDLLQRFQQELSRLLRDPELLPCNVVVILASWRAFAHHSARRRCSRDTARDASC